MNKDEINSRQDINKLTSIYQDRWQQHGVSPLSLGWTKGKQDMRFNILLSDLPCEGRSFLDVGCGFGDLNLSIQQRTPNYSYLGIDMVPEFITQGRKHYGCDNISFITGDFLSSDIEGAFDYVLASGIFGFKLSKMDNYTYIERILRKMFQLSTVAIAVDFLSDQINFRRENNFYANPGKILEIGFSITKNLRLRHDYMPFEFSLTMFKDDSYEESDTVFRRYKDSNKNR